MPDLWRTSAPVYYELYDLLQDVSERKEDYADLEPDIASDAKAGIKMYITPDRREYLRRRYLDRKERRVHPPLVRPLQHWWEGHEIQQSPVLDETFAHQVLVSGLLPLLQLPEAEALPKYNEMLVGTTQVASLSEPALKKGNAFDEDAECAVSVVADWEIDSAALISADFSEDDWQDEVERGMRDFVQFHVLHMAGPRDVLNVPVNSPLEFEAFAMFDREWAREVWELVRDDFRTHVVVVLDSASRSQTACPGLWLLVPWIVGSLCRGLLSYTSLLNLS
ncbi:hypothetical protein V1508DRAFT_400416 [Lipomyces doorenjongii]|uniref:uncharacterized protein n=1 Tax=Lipomyces doorenjongii TaxID=383834 RepID=UPI0034CFD1C2